MLRSYTAPTSWLPLSDQIMLIFPRRKMNLLIDMSKKGVAKSPVTPNCRAWFVKHIKSTVCSYQVTYMFQSKSTLSSCLNVKNPLLGTGAILSLSDCNEIRTRNHLVCKPVWLNDCVFVYELRRCGFESRCSHVNSISYILLFPWVYHVLLDVLTCVGPK